MYVAITGTHSSGKGEIARILKRRGFRHYSFSEVLREHAVKMGVGESPHSITRQQLTTFANKQRALLGPGFLAEILLHKVQEDAPKHAVLETVRTLGELNVLRRLPGLVLMAVDAPRELRYERLRQRGEYENIHSFEEFTAWDDKFLEGKENEQHIGAVMDQADVALVNIGNLEELEEQVREALNI
jgi:dephospho-CoA kinase